MTQNFIIIFPQGAGGNHLANIVSTSSDYQQRFSPALYSNLTVNAHPVEAAVNFRHSDSYYSAISNQNNVMCGHLAEYLWKRNIIEQTLPNRKYCIIEFPDSTRNQLFINRLADMSYRSKYLIEELSTLYSIDIFNRITGETDLSKITVDLIFNKDVNPLIDQLEAEWGLHLNRATVMEMHKKWMALINK